MINSLFVLLEHETVADFMDAIKDSDVLIEDQPHTTGQVAELVIRFENAYLLKRYMNANQPAQTVDCVKNEILLLQTTWTSRQQDYLYMTN